LYANVTYSRPLFVNNGLSIALACLMREPDPSTHGAFRGLAGGDFPASNPLGL
jgi:hypothetical protein